MHVIAQQATESDWDWLKDSSIVVAAVGLAGIVLTAWINVMLSRRRERRERYAAMAATLAAWIEIPYMIRRRTSNDREAIDRIVAHIQQLQHQLNVDHADLRADCRWLATCRDQAQQAIQLAARPYIAQAWAMSPVATTTDLVVGDWGPREARRSVEAFVDLLRWRFGWSRIVNPARRLYQCLRHRRRKTMHELVARPTPRQSEGVARD